VANQDKKRKIALVGYKLAKGGLERVFGSVSHLLNDANCEVYVIVLENEIEYSHSGKLINLGHFSKFQKYFQLRKLLKRNQFDYIIDFRHRINPGMELVFLHYIYANFRTIYTIHSSKLEVYLTNNKFVARQIFKKVHTIVAVSIALNEKIKRDFHFSKGVVISNSISEKEVVLDATNSRLPFKYCIAVGRLVSLKQFDKLIETYCQSDLFKNDIHLVILGDGEEKKRLQKQIENTELSAFIHLLGFKENTFEFLKNAEFLILSSKYEGFPMVILEALYMGTPVISLDCKTGPAEMIRDEFNGLLVENQNFEALKTAMDKLIMDKELYNFCKQNAKESTAPFSEDNIQRQWLDLLNINTN
jgi:glycosyltransferase involved in cell wall biosynthesis